MNPLKALLNRLKRFRRDSSGTITVEFAIIIPMLFWGYASSYIFFDGFRQSTINLRAAYTIGDMISRETDVLTPDYIDSMYNMSLRITVIRWDEDDDQFYLDWSQARGGVGVMVQENLVDFADYLPVMPDQERVIVVETWNTWEPVINVGMNARDMDNFVFTRPRFAPQVIFEG